MHEVVTSNSSELFLEINDPVASVRLLPDVVSRVYSKSIIVSHQNNLLHEKYAVKVVEYGIGLKSINTEIARSLTAVSDNYKDVFHNESIMIEGELLKMRDCNYPENFLTVWDVISQAVTNLFDKINKLGASFVQVEQLRLDKIRNHMQEHYITVNKCCHCDKGKLNIFFDKEISIINSVSLKNYRSYTSIISLLKMQLVKCFNSWHYWWEVLLFTWRDSITKQNIEKVERLSRDESFLVPTEVKYARSSCLLTLEYVEDTIHDIIINLATNMPVSIEVAVQTVNKIGNTFSHCEAAIQNFQSFSSNVFEDKFSQIIGHVAEMRGYLTSSCVFEENKSLELFEYSVYAICTEFEKNINALQHQFSNEMKKSVKSKRNVCDTIKGFVFQVCNVWGTYLQAYKLAYNDFIDQLDRDLKIHNNKILWLERALDKTCSSLIGCRTVKSLDKMRIAVCQKLDNILAEYHRYKKALENVLDVYLEKWLEVEKTFEENMLKVLNLNKLSSTEEPPRHSFIFEGNSYLQENINTTCPDIVLKFKDSCSKAVVAMIAQQKRTNIQGIKINLSARIKQTQYEAEIRIDLHNPRLSVIERDIYHVRKNEIVDFKLDCDKFWDEVTCGEMKYTQLFEQLCSDTDVIVENHGITITDLEIGMTDKETSNDLMLLKPLIENRQAESKDRLNSVIDIFQSKIIGHKGYVRDKRMSLLQHAGTKNLKFSHDQQIKNEYDEFSELADDMTIKADLEREKVDKIHDAGDRTLSHYKHTLFGLFYLEKKDNLLKTCRIRIKTEAASCSKEISKLEKDIKAFISQKLCSSFDRVDELISGFKEMYTFAKQTVNMLNYSSGTGDKFARCISMEKLQRRYSKFGEGQSRSFDGVFLKEIINTAKKTVSVHELCPPNRDDTNWKVPRLTVVRQRIGTRIIKARYGVGVKKEQPATINPHVKALNQRKAALNFQGATYWLVQKSKKGEAVRTAEEHNSIVAKACAKLRDRRFSKISKSVQERLPNIKNMMDSSSSLSSPRSDTVSLPPISQQSSATSSRASFITQSNSADQVDMEATLALIRTAEFLSSPQRSTLSSNSDGSTVTAKFYDFNQTPDETMKQMLFEPVDFFNLKKRTHDIDIVSKHIVSFLEKTKFFLRHVLEDSIIVSEVYFRQKNICITKKSVPKDVELACKGMEADLQEYYEKVNKYCREGTEKIKSLAYELNSYQGLFITTIFKTVSTTYYCDIQKARLNFESTLIGDCHTEREEGQNALFSQLRPYMSHPNHHRKLFELRESADQLSASSAEKLTILHSKTTISFRNLHEASLKDIENYKMSLYNIADITIHPVLVKKITRSKFKGVVHQECLQDHVPGESNTNRKLHQLFSDAEKAKDREQERTGQQAKFYDHIALESARAIVRVNRVFEEEQCEIDERFDSEMRAVYKWKKYWERNLRELIGVQ